MRPPLRELLARAGRRLSSSSGLECSLEGGTKRGAYCTSVDAFVIVKADAARRAYLMEWKYAEKPTVNKVEEWRRRYSERYSAKSSAFSNVVPMDELFYDPQLMRFRFLADRMMTNGELGVSEAKVVVVVPEGNSAYRGRITSPPLANRFPHFKSVSEAMCATLKQPDSRGFSLPGCSELSSAVAVGMPTSDKSICESEFQKFENSLRFRGPAGNAPFRFEPCALFATP